MVPDPRCSLQRRYRPASAASKEGRDGARATGALLRPDCVAVNCARDAGSIVPRPVLPAHMATAASGRRQCCIKCNCRACGLHDQPLHRDHQHCSTVASRQGAGGQQPAMVAPSEPTGEAQDGAPTLMEQLEMQVGRRKAQGGPGRYWRRVRRPRVDRPSSASPAHPTAKPIPHPPMRRPLPSSTSWRLRACRRRGVKRATPPAASESLCWRLLRRRPCCPSSWRNTWTAFPPPARALWTSARVGGWTGGPAVQPAGLHRVPEAGHGQLRACAPRSALWCTTTCRACHSDPSTRLPAPTPPVYPTGLRLRYLEWGSGSRDVVLLLHDCGEAADVWRPIGPRLADRGYRVIAPDLRGQCMFACQSGDRCSEVLLCAAGVEPCRSCAEDCLWNRCTCPRVHFGAHARSPLLQSLPLLAVQATASPGALWIAGMERPAWQRM